MDHESNSTGTSGSATILTWTAWLRQNRFVDLYEIDESRPNSFDQVKWEPTVSDRAAAWAFYTELRTRVTTQSLRLLHGDEDAALDSVYRLFDLARTIIKAHDGCTHFATLTTRILNLRVRPFTADWHGKKVTGRLTSADERFAFRRELAELQPFLRTFTSLLGLLAGDDQHIVEEERNPPPDDTMCLSWIREPLPFGIPDETLTDAAAINTAEAQEVAWRRKFYELENSGAAVDAVGLALSGGGIRSATFALGAVQSLARRGILRDVDFLSTVSGGGYLGSFITSYTNDVDERVTLRPQASALPFGMAEATESQGVRHLRNHSKYLSEGGIRTIAVISALVMYGIFISILLVAPILLTAALFAALAFPEIFATPTKTAFLPATIACAVLACSVIILPGIQTFSRNQELQKSWSAACVWLTAITLGLLAAGTVPYLFNAIGERAGAALGGAIAAASVLGILGLRLGANSIAGRAAFAAFVMTGPILFLLAFFLLYRSIQADRAVGNGPLRLEIVVGIAVFLWGYTSFVLNINFASPHAYYRSRLARTYLTHVAGPGDAVTMRDPQLLSGMNALAKAPYHLLNAALNIPACKDPNLRGRNTDFFLFSKHYCGSPIIGYEATLRWESMDKHIDLGTAMAISAAAAAPHMGTMTSLRYTLLLALLNIRLGYWAKRPRGDAASAHAFSLPPVGWYYFLRELTGWMSEATPFLNLSDGGHIENLGIYELLRRRCKFVIAIDGEADPARSFGGLLTLTRLAHIDLGITIEPNLADMQVDRTGTGRSHFGLSRIIYPGGRKGLLLYIKTSLTGNESEFLKKYHNEHPDFPHESTAQQLFSETQFEAYRALGEHVAEDLFRADLAGAWIPTLRTKDWFERLARQLL